MTRIFALWFALCSLAGAAELRIDFSGTPPGRTPAGFTPMLVGSGAPGDWRVVMDDVAPLMAPLSPQAPAVTKRAVLGQFSTDPTDERFPLLAYDGESFEDFTLTTRFKIMGGAAEQMAGIAFRLQDERNFYVIRASALGRNVRFYKVVDGVRSRPIGPELEIPTNQWQELKIRCQGSEIRCQLNGREAMPALNDSSFRFGKIGFWTKSDSVVYFSDTVVDYTPRIPLGQQVVSSVMEKNSRLVALQLYVKEDGTNATRVIASKDAAEIGTAGGKYELSCIEDGQIFFSKASSHAAVVMPVRDRNGDVVAAARIHLTTFPGQTEKNAIIRATPIVKEIEARIRTSNDPLR